MFQNWIGIQDFVREHQKDLLREAEAERVRQGAARIRAALRKTGSGRPRPDRPALARGSCLDCPGQMGTAPAGNA